MSESEKERSDVVGGGGGDDDDDDDDGVGSSRRDGQEKQRGEWCEGHVGKPKKKMAFFRFRKVKKQHHRRNKRPSNPSSTTTGCSGKRVCGGGGGCYLCFKQPQALDSPIGSQTSDPNNPEFSYELLRALIETNDFYSKECNPHLDVGMDNRSSCTDDK